MAKILASIVGYINYLHETGILITIIQLVTFAALLFAAIYTSRSAKEARKSAKTTELTMQAEIYVRLWEYYASKEMFESLRLLRIVGDSDAFKKWSKAGANTLAKDLEENKIKGIKKVIEKKVPDYRHYQRFVKYYFLRIYHLDKQGFLPEHLVKDLLSVDGIELFFKVVKPLEYLENEDFNSSHFDALCDRAKELGIKELPNKTDS